ncbi:MAG TPA: ParA family protein [Vicinamibacterales bacterium]|nr:ParA family protein [Vicinamibacterales bacterium]
MIIAAFNPKGGVGKTTTAVNVAATIAAAGKSVLVVDLEADLNASISLGFRPGDGHPSIYELLLNASRPVEAVRPVPRIDQLFLITGSPALAQMNERLRNVRQPERRLADVLRPLERQFDAIVLDSPADYGIIPTSVPLAAQHLIVPIRAEYLALESLAHFLRWYHDYRRARRATADVGGILLTMVDHRRPATREIIDIIRTHNRRGVLRTEIPYDPRVGEAPSHGVPLVRYTRSRAAVAYQHLTTELLRRLARRAR